MRKDALRIKKVVRFIHPLTHNLGQPSLNAGNRLQPLTAANWLLELLTCPRASTLPPRAATSARRLALLSASFSFRPSPNRVTAAAGSAPGAHLGSQAPRAVTAAALPSSLSSSCSKKVRRVMVMSERSWI